MANEDKKPNLFRSLFPETNQEEKNVIKKSFKGDSTAEDLAVRFAENFTDTGGKFVYSDDASIFFKLLQSLQHENEWNQFFVCDSDINIFMSENHFENGEGFQKMEDCDVAISYCFGLIADEGIVLLEPHQATNRRLTNFPKHHVIVAKKSKLYTHLEEAIEEFTLIHNDKLPSIIELSKEKPIYNANKARLLSADGMSNLYVFYIDEA